MFTDTKEITTVNLYSIMKVVNDLLEDVEEEIQSYFENNMYADLEIIRSAIDELERLDYSDEYYPLDECHYDLENIMDLLSTLESEFNQLELDCEDTFTNIISKLHALR